MSRGMINLLLFFCWLLALALLLFRIVPGWVAFAMMGLLIVIGTIANAAGKRVVQTSQPVVRQEVSKMPGGFGRKNSGEDIIQAIDRKRREQGLAALTEPERRLYEGNVFEAYFFHQGGFDYYFAHVEDADRWAYAVGALIWIGRDDVTPIFHEAATLYTSFDHGAADQDATKAYLSQIREIDARFRAAIPDLEARLQEYAKRI